MSRNWCNFYQVCSVQSPEIKDVYLVQENNISMRKECFKYESNVVSSVLFYKRQGCGKTEA